MLSACRCEDHCGACDTLDFGEAVVVRELREVTTPDEVNDLEPEFIEVPSMEIPRLLGAPPKTEQHGEALPKPTEQTMGVKLPVEQCGAECGEVCGAKLAKASGPRSVSWLSKHAESDAVCLQEIKNNTMGVLLQQIQELDAGYGEAATMSARGDDLRGNKPAIVIVGHPSMLKLLTEFVRSYAHLLTDFRIIGNAEIHDIVATVSESSGTPLSVAEPCLPSGPLGCDSCISQLIFQSAAQAIIYFRDPLAAHVNKSDTISLARLADTYQLYFCTNYRTAAAVLEELHYKMSALQAETLL
eukprot:TRINITY_DN8452_c0_g1_i1.p1 TRINITY_DN8452_c0_g1~~TRINITY_DN8452_c0_g1_i1.p1  ORF type:complete len:300 (+),score=54.41 TRINITY_DN8452_c0_g1_i1:147-1046(+)